MPEPLTAASPESPAPGAQRGTKRSLRSALLLMLFAPVLPLVLVCAAAVWYQWWSQSEQVYESLKDGANAISLAIDGDIDRSRAVLETLAASELIDERNWRAFHRLASEAIRNEPDSFIALTEPSGLQPVRTMVPYDQAPVVNPLAYAKAHAEAEWNGRRLPLSTQGLAQRVFDTGRMSNSGLYYGISIKKPAVSIAVPVIRDGRVVNVLIMGFSVDRLVRLVQAAGSGQTRVTIIDGSGRIIARNWKPEEGVGVVVSDAVAAAISTAPAGVRKGVNLSGQTTVGAFRRMTLVDWTIYQSVPESVAFSRATRGIIMWSVIATAFLALGLFIARRLWLRLAPPLASLGRSARAIQRGEAHRMPASNIAEIDDLAGLLQEAAAAEQREREEATRRAVAEQSERATRELVAALTESENRFRTLFEYSGTGIGSVDLETGRFVLVNRRLSEITGYSEAELLQLTYADVTHPDYRDSDREAIAQLLSGRRESYDVEERYVRKDGDVRWVQVHVRHFPRGSGAKPLSFASVIDITQRKEAELALKAADRRKDEFLATLAHELRNPLAPLRSGIDILKLRYRDPPTVERVHALMDRQVKHMVRLIDDLLDVSRIATGRLQLQNAVIDLREVAHAATEACRSLVDAGKHTLTIEASDAPVLVEGDSTRLIQVVQNLLTNAVKYTEKPGTIVLGARKRGDQAVLTVRDTGMGVPPDKLHMIFDMFSQVHGSRGSGKDRGLGIGLHLVKRLVELHGGTVAARSEGEGSGTEFVVELPLARAAQAGPDTTATVVEPAGPVRILVVDDNVDAAESLAGLLGLSGHDVRTAFRGQDALEILQRWQADLLLLDIGMPDIDGHEVATRIRTMALASQPYIVAVSGWGKPEDRSRTAEAGCDRHLVKPVELVELQSVLAYVWRRLAPGRKPA